MTPNQASTTTYSDASRLDRLLQDPLIRLVMASDGVADADIRRLARQVAGRGGASTPRNACAGCA